MRVMGDQHDARAVVNVPVIHDVDEQFVQRLVLNPVVEDGNDVFQVRPGQASWRNSFKSYFTVSTA